tara:strand:- start:33918 stop:35444 length:1527 start_codon:yes stop_codon:yes gene_type:complete
MGVDSTHPLYDQKVKAWRQMRDTHSGQPAVKDAGPLYLSPTAGMELDGLKQTAQPGAKAYAAYKARAVFPELVSDAIEAMLGVMHHKPPVIELPESMEPLRERATLQGESLVMFLRRLNEEQLATGRAGMLAEVPDDNAAKLPLIALYIAEDVINWDEGDRQGIEVDNLNVVGLNESAFVRLENFEWEFKKKYRMLILGDPLENEPTGKGVYRAGEFDEDSSEFNETALVTPSIAGRTSDEIPFVFVNAKDIVPEPDDPPLLGLSNAALTIYRGEADYRQALFLQGQDTLVVSGDTVEGEVVYRTGAGASISLPMGGDAKFIGVDSTGLSEMRSALENDHARAQVKAGQLVDESSRAKESGDALRIRVAARTATLNQIALAGAFALQEILRKIARWIGADPEQVVVEPNLDFTDEVMTGADLAAFLGAKMLGAPLSGESIHKMMTDKGVTEKTFEEELEVLAKEAENEILNPPPATDEDGLEDDEDEGGDDNAGDDEGDDNDEGDGEG